jgi:predicted nucleic acid-binding protein
MYDKKVFLDTNVELYAWSHSEQDKRQVSRQLVMNNHVVISTQVLQEMSNILKRKFKLPYAAIKKTLKECVDDSDEVYTNEVQTVFMACDIAARYQFSFYDSLIIASALESGCEILYSEDLQHNRQIDDKLTIINPYICIE